MVNYKFSIRKSIDRLFKFVRHPFVIMLAGGFLFSYTIAKYNIICNQNTAIMQTGLLPAQNAYIKCKNTLIDIGTLYENIKLRIMDIQNLHVSYGFPNTILQQLVVLDNRIHKNTTSIEKLERTRETACDQVYSYLSFSARLLGIDRKYEIIHKERKQEVAKLLVQKELFKSQINLLKVDSRNSYNLLARNYRYVTMWTPYIYRANYFYTEALEQDYIKLAFLQIRLSVVEEKYYQEINSIIYKSFYKRLHKNYFSYFFS